jgi:hypothetical protein
MSLVIQPRRHHKMLRLVERACVDAASTFRLS